MGRRKIPERNLGQGRLDFNMYEVEGKDAELAMLQFGGRKAMHGRGGYATFQLASPENALETQIMG